MDDGNVMKEKTGIAATVVEYHDAEYNVELLEPNTVKRHGQAPSGNWLRNGTVLLEFLLGPNMEKHQSSTNIRLDSTKAQTHRPTGHPLHFDFRATGAPVRVSGLLESFH